jgi:serine/threonine-protein kinase
MAVRPGVDVSTVDDGANSANFSILMVSLDQGHRSQPLIQTQFIERNGIVSPDGRWIAYESNATGQFEIYTRPFPMVGDGQWQISTAGGTRPLWGSNGRELFYVAPNGALMSVSVESRGAWHAGTPAQVVAASYLTIGFAGVQTVFTGRSYDVSADGTRFLMIKNASESGATLPAASMIVVQNWFDELRRRVRTK